MPPIKLTHKQRIQKKIENSLIPIHNDLDKINNALHNSPNPETWRWAALDIFYTLTNKFPTDSLKVEYEKERALAIARKAQVIMNSF